MEISILSYVLGWILPEEREREREREREEIINNGGRVYTWIIAPGHR